MAVSRYRVRFTKREALRFISHHDLLRVFELALRRSGLKVAHTQGFNPRPKLSFALALSLGIESLDELVDIDLLHDDAPLAPPELVKVLGAQLPAGLTLLQAEFATGRPVVEACEYECEIPPTHDLQQLQQRLSAFMESASHPHTRDRGSAKRPRHFDARAYTLQASIEANETRRVLRMRLKTGDDGGMKPTDLLQIIGLDPTRQLVTKTRTVLGLPETTQTNGTAPEADAAPDETITQSDTLTEMTEQHGTQDSDERR